MGWGAMEVVNRVAMGYAFLKGSLSFKYYDKAAGS